MCLTGLPRKFGGRRTVRCGFCESGVLKDLSYVDIFGIPVGSLLGLEAFCDADVEVGM
jgi:hypothetical protein